MKNPNKNPKVLAVIPARGGSKRLPRKNVMDLQGHPMLAYSIFALKNAKNVTSWLVSSEDQEILDVASKYDAPVPFIRPKHLATDEVRNIDVVLHALEFMENKEGFIYDIILLIQPTAPIRDPLHIDEAIEKLWNSDLPTLASVKGPYQKRDPILKKIDENGMLVNYRDNDQNPREPFYIYNASLYAVKREYFVKEKKFVSEKQVPLVMDRYHSADVDELADLITAKAFMDQIEKNRRIK